MSKASNNNWSNVAVENLPNEEMIIMHRQNYSFPDDDDDDASTDTLQDIDQPHSHDVLLCQGDEAASHLGNAQWRMLVQANLRIYLSLGRMHYKRLLVHSIIVAIRGQDPSGRFLKKDPRTNLWHDVGNSEAQIWTSSLFDQMILEERGDD